MSCIAACIRAGFSVRYFVSRVTAVGFRGSCWTTSRCEMRSHASGAGVMRIARAVAGRKGLYRRALAGEGGSR